MEDVNSLSSFSTMISAARVADCSAVVSGAQGSISSVDGHHRRLFCRADQPDSPTVKWRGDNHCFHSLNQTEYLEGFSTALERLQVSLVLNIETARALLEDLESSLIVCAARLTLDPDDSRVSGQRIAWVQSSPGYYRLGYFPSGTITQCGIIPWTRDHDHFHAASSKNGPIVLFGIPCECLYISRSLV